MRKTLFGVLVIAAVIALVYPVQAAEWNLYLSKSETDTASGNTTSKTATTGVSVLYVEGGGMDRADGYTAISRKTSDKPYWIVQFGTSAIQQVSSGASALVTGVTDTSSGTTFEFGYQVAYDDSMIGNAEKVPVMVNMALNSSTSKYQVPFIVPQAGNVRFYMKPTGVTPMNDWQATVANFDGQGWPLPGPLYLSAEQMVVNSNCAGTSTFTVPSGCDWVQMTVSGSTLWYTLDGSTAGVHQDIFLPFGATAKVLPAGMVEDMKAIGESSLSTGVTATAVYWRGKPE